MTSSVPRERTAFQTIVKGQTVAQSGVSRSDTTGKPQYARVYDGPMLRRWAELLTRGAEHYPDEKPGQPNWMLANTEEDYQRFIDSAARHFAQWIAGERDEDHAAAVIFNLNGAEYVRAIIDAESPV